MRTVVLDNGAHSIKAADPTRASTEIFANSVTRSKQDKRNYVADEIDECRDFGNLIFRRPFELGILNNWDVQKVVWDRVFGSKGRGLGINKPKETRLAVTEPIFNLPNVQEHYDQMLFEEYEFDAVLRCPAACFVPPADVELAVVVDAGFSFTHITPVLNRKIVKEAVRRIDVGGKVLTNYMKELVSYRHVYMMDQTSAVEHMKEVSCYVALDYAAELAKARAETVRTYVLPDFMPTSKNKLGYLLPAGVSKPAVAADGKEEDEEELLQLDRERYQVPELLFNPSSIGMPQMGLAEALADSIESLPSALQGLAWSNVICVGGTSLLPSFKERLGREARSLASADHDVRITLADDPILAAVHGFTSLPDRGEDEWTTRQDYFEQGSKRRLNKFYLSTKDIRI